MCSGGKKQKKDKSVERENARRSAAIAEGLGAINGQFAGFNDGFFEDRQKSYLDYALPQIDDQFKEAQSQLIFALSRSGNRNTSAGAEQLGKLDQQLGDRRREAVDSARAVANQTRQDVAGQKSDLINQLNATFDPATASQGARSRAEFLSQAPAFAPLSTLFELPTQIVGDAINQAKFGRGFNGGGTSLFQSPVGGGSQVVVG